MLVKFSGFSQKLIPIVFDIHNQSKDSIGTSLERGKWIYYPYCYLRTQSISNL